MINQILWCDFVDNTYILPSEIIPIIFSYLLINDCPLCERKSKYVYLPCKYHYFLYMKYKIYGKISLLYYT